MYVNSDQLRRSKVWVATGSLLDRDSAIRVILMWFVCHHATAQITFSIQMSSGNFEPIHLCLLSLPSRIKIRRSWPTAPCLRSTRFSKSLLFFTRATRTLVFLQSALLALTATKSLVWSWCLPPNTLIMCVEPSSSRGLSELFDMHIPSLEGIRVPSLEGQPSHPLAVLALTWMMI